MSRPTPRGKLKAIAVVFWRLIHSPSTRKDELSLPMKTSLPIVLLAGLSVAGIAQDAVRAHIPYNIPDGTPPPPAPVKPGWVVPAEDVVSEKSHAEGGRTIRVRQIQPIALPPPPEPAELPAPVEITEEFRARMAEYREKHPRQRMIALGATVYRLEDGSTLSLVRASYGEGEAAPVFFWSSGDFSLLSGIGSFIDKQGDTRAMFMSWSIHDTARIAKWLAGTGREYKAPVIPELSNEQAAYAIHEGNPDAGLLMAIDSLHEILNHDGAELRRAYEGRARAAKEREDYLKANPPQPQDITVNFWPIEKPATGEKGAQP